MYLTELPLSAQTAYAELFSQTQAFELDNALAGLVGAFHRRTLKGRAYWYFGYRDIDQRLRMVYVGPDSDRVQSLVHRFEQMRRDKPLAPPARMAIAAGCTPVAPKHFRLIRRLAEYGFFRAGGILIGTHAFLALGNMLGVRWRDGAATLDVDSAHAGRNVSLALPAGLKVGVHGALESLETGLLPVTQFRAKIGTHYRNPANSELRLSLVTAISHNGTPAVMADQNLTLEPQKFVELLLEQPLQGCVFSNQGACIVNIPAPERYAVHKLIAYGERLGREEDTASKDILQAASLVSYFLQNDQTEVFNAAWRKALSCGTDWQTRAVHGKEALLRTVPELNLASLWQT